VTANFEACQHCRYIIPVMSSSAIYANTMKATTKEENIIKIKYYVLKDIKISFATNL
jgi:hypothetical protein